MHLDDNGYCLHHPHVQLAKMRKKSGGWKILMEYCPECAEDSLLKCFSDNLSCRSGQSGRSCRSSDSRRSFIESMPYVDGEGEAGHYTGHVDISTCQPQGIGKLKYLNGNKFNGVWHEGVKVSGKISKKTKSRTRKNSPSTQPLTTKKQSSNGRSRGRRAEDQRRRLSRQDSCTSSRSRRSLSRLRKQCDEMEALLKGYSGTVHDESTIRI